MSIEDEIARIDWSRVQTYLGEADMMPGALRALAAAPDDTEANRLGVWIERILLSGAGPSEGCAPVAADLVGALPRMTPPGRRVTLDLLAQISAAEITGPPHEQIGAVDVQKIRQAVANGFPYYVAVLRSESSSVPDLYSCVGLMDVLAFHDRGLAAEAIAALKAVRTAGRAADLAGMIDITLDDLTGSPDDST